MKLEKEKLVLGLFKNNEDDNWLLLENFWK